MTDGSSHFRSPRARVALAWLWFVASSVNAGAPPRQDSTFAPSPTPQLPALSASPTATVVSAQQTGDLWLATARAGELQRSRIARAADGSYIAVRDNADASQAVGEPSVFIRRLDAAGNPMGAETLAGRGTAPGVAAFPDGSFVVTWLAPPPATFSLTVPVVGQRFDRSLLPVGTAMSLGVTGNHAQPVALPNGNFALSTFGHFSRVAGPSGFVRTYTRDGAEVGAAVQLHDDACGIQAPPAVSALNTGGFAVAWPYACVSAPQVRMRVYDANGNVGASTRMAVGPQGETVRVSLAPLSDGNLVLQWTVGAAVPREVRTLVVAPVALPQSPAGATLVPLQPGRTPIGVQALAGGGFVITWSVLNVNEARVPVTRFSNAGAAL